MQINGASLDAVRPSFSAPAAAARPVAETAPQASAAQASPPVADTVEISTAGSAMAAAQAEADA